MPDDGLKETWRNPRLDADHISPSGACCDRASMAVLRLPLVRPRATWNNLENGLTGQTDAGLSVVGSCQARAVGERLSREPLEASVASHLGRTRSSAQMSVRHHLLPVQEGSPSRHKQKCIPRL